jgi:hypothetical protein
MAYTINSKDGTIIVEDGTVNTTTPLSLVGRDYFGYGTEVAQNFIDLLENFATTEPAEAKRVTGMSWYDDANQSLKIWNGASWLGTTFNEYTVLDNTSGEHTVFIAKGDAAIVAVMSSTAFTLNASETDLIAALPTTAVGAGITLASGMKFHGTATSAEYADLAELYLSDAEYAPGTVVKLGGSAEVTQTTSALDGDVFGIVSTDPAYLMNSAIPGMSVAVALAGRVPCLVIGEVRKGQRIVSSETPGVARAASEHEHAEGLDWFKVIGRALEDKTTLSVGTIEVVVGTK